MSAADKPANTRFVLLRFTVLIVFGFAVLTGTFWLVASQSWAMMDWIYQDQVYHALAVAIAICATAGAQLRHWRDVILALLITCAAHFMLLILPLILLLGYPNTSYLRQYIAEAMGPALLVYAVALSLTFLVQVARQKRMKSVR